MTAQSAKTAIIGAGSTGIATAYYLATQYGFTDIVLIDANQPMTFTSAQSGENYRNWWPHPSMSAFADRSIDLLEDIALKSDNRINMNRRGYSLVSRDQDVDAVLARLHINPAQQESDNLRFHESASSTAYVPPLKPGWETAPSGIDILQNQALIRRTFPSYAPDIRTVVHIRRGGDISGQQLGMYMLEAYRKAGGKRITGSVEEISQGDNFTLTLHSPEGTSKLKVDTLINAAGPFAGNIANMLGVNLPLSNSFQQKIAFEDKSRAIPRDMPFSVDLDDQNLDWTATERDYLLEDDNFLWLAETLPGGVHCRPDGGDNGTWLKLGWAFNHEDARAAWEPPLEDQFPEIVLRGAARLNPSLKAYYDHLPGNMHHYGGWYTRTDENWPLIGPMGPDNAFMNCALSGFGTMAACAGGELCAAWVAEADLPDYASDFSMKRYMDEGLMALLRKSNRGLL